MVFPTKSANISSVHRNYYHRWSHNNCLWPHIYLACYHPINNFHTILHWLLWLGIHNRLSLLILRLLILSTIWLSLWRILLWLSLWRISLWRISLWLSLWRIHWLLVIRRRLLVVRRRLLVVRGRLLVSIISLIWLISSSCWLYNWRLNLNKKQYLP